MSNYNVPNQFTPFAPADADQMTANFSEVATLLNSTGLDSTGLASNSVTTVKIVNDAVTTAKIADGAVTSGKLAAGSVTPIKNASTTATGISSVTLTTYGRPVLIKFQPLVGAQSSSLGGGNSSIVTPTTDATGKITISRDGTSIAVYKVGRGGASAIPLSFASSGDLSFVDYTVTAGSHTWTVATAGISASGSAFTNFLNFIVIEL